MILDRIALPLATNATIVGPRCLVENQSLVVEYDHEEEDGSISWAHVVFHQVIEFGYRQAAGCKAEDVLEPNEIICLHDSAMLRDTVDRWRQSVGWQKYQQELGGAARFKHYKIYFDDAGSIDVIAAGCSVKSGRAA